MAVVKLTFDGSLNTAKQDAAFNHYIASGQIGIVKGLGGEVAATSSNSRITFSDGYVMAYGRKVYIEEGTSIDITLDSSACGYVVVSIDTSQNTVTLHTKEKSSGYPALTQDNLLESDGKYELPICSYIKTSSSLIVSTVNVTYIKNANLLVEESKSALTAKINQIQNGMKYTYMLAPTPTKNVYTFTLSDEIKKKDCVLIHFYVANNVFTVSLSMLKGITSLMQSFRYLNNDYSLSLEYSNGKLYVDLSSTSFTLKGINLIY